MKNSKFSSGSAHLIILATVCVVLVSAGLFFAYQKGAESKKVDESRSAVQSNDEEGVSDKETTNTSDAKSNDVRDATTTQRDVSFLDSPAFISQSNLYKSNGAGKFINDFYVEYMKTRGVYSIDQTNAYVEKNSTDVFIEVYREHMKQPMYDRIVCAQNSFDSSMIKYANPKTQDYIESYDVYLPFSSNPKLNVGVTKKFGDYKISHITCPSN